MQQKQRQESCDLTHAVNKARKNLSMIEQKINLQIQHINILMESVKHIESSKLESLAYLEKMHGELLKLDPVDELELKLNLQRTHVNKLRAE